MIATFVGFLCLIGAGVLGYHEFGFRTGNLILGGVSAGVMIGALWLLKFLPGSRMAKRFISQRAVGELGLSQPDLLHRTGVAITQLRPSGAAFINGKRVDMITEGALIDRGASIKVMAVKGARVVVREV